MSGRLIGQGLLVALVAAAVSSAAFARTLMILPTHTPGARYAKVTQATISKTL